MVFPYDNRPPGRHVPLHVAQKLAKQRDELLAEVQKLRRENDRLAASSEAADSQIAALKRRLAEANREAHELREELAADLAAAEEHEPPEEPTPAEGAEHLIERLSARIDELNSDLERVRDRTDRTVNNARRDERVRLLSGLGAVLDSIERGLDIEASGAWRQGLEAIRQQLIAFFKAEGAKLIGEPGQRMDPKIHEAVEMVESDEFDSGQVVRVERRGLQLEDGTLVRPARVAVAK